MDKEHVKHHKGDAFSKTQSVGNYTKINYNGRRGKAGTGKLRRGREEENMGQGERT